MAQTFYPTAQQVIDAALRAIRAVDPDSAVDPNTTQRNNALQALNFLVTSWQAHGMQVWCQAEATATLVAGQSAYECGFTNEINIPRPTSVQQAWLRNTDNMDMPLRIIGREEYNDLSAKTSQATPNSLFYDRRYDITSLNIGPLQYGVINLWPVPDTNIAADQTLHFVYTRPINDFSGVGDFLDFPQEWFNAVKWNLAYEIAPEYGVPVMYIDRIGKRAEETLNLVKGWDREEDSILFSPATETSR